MENDLIKEHHVLILGALKKCHVTTYHPLFEDYLQIARWTLIETHRRFIEEDTEMSTFNQYVYQRIYWKITDEIRKERLNTERQENSSSDDTLLQLPDKEADDLLEVKELLEKISPLLTDIERCFLEDAYIHDLSILEIAKKNKTSRNTVYKCRNRVALKVIKFLNT
ncbi:sigma-70 family RNA polymerase sigma factor [Vagococcus hydrophili]|uniref:Sigma-70 family RNA polymerase sigma factor n=1 Tax=Vagococcus hydrophili TaxID=2714947 RepID=A0A6G8AQR4_9ENTE|nr:sigma-70 family RNA polymerase sigma factor [Vagococcus hydrophili]QIL47411.1 sigma-70 family RNA polymerase sigma factor [Vagococcus hydrophili]